MISVVGCAAAVLVGGSLLWVAIAGGAGRAAPRRAANAANAASVAATCGVGLAALHAGLALRTSSSVLLFAAPGYAAAGALLGLWWCWRRRGGRMAAPGIRAVALCALVLLAFSVVREHQLRALRTAAASPPEVRAAERTLDLSAKSWPAAFEALCTDLAARYPFTRWKGIDWRRRCAAAAPRVAAAAMARDSRAWYRAVRDFAWDIPDGHVGLTGDDQGLEEQEIGGGFGLRLVQLADRRVVACEVVAGGAAARAGVRFGAEILTWDGLPIERALDRVPVLWAARPPATAEAKRAAQLRFLPRAPVGARANVRFRNRGAAAAGEGSLMAVQAWPRTYEGDAVTFGIAEAVAGRAVEWRWLAGEAGQCGAAGGAIPSGDGPAGPVAGGRSASSGLGRWAGNPCGSSGVGYIRIRYEMPTLWQADMGQAVGRALRELAAIEANDTAETDAGDVAKNGKGVVGDRGRAAAGIVLDVRGNGGGIDAMVPPVLGHFVTGRQVYEIPGLAAPGGTAGGVGEADGVGDGFLPLVARTRYVEPREPRFGGRIAVLIDGETGSAGEGFPLRLQGQPNVAVFGFAGTGGYFAVGQRSVRLPGGLTLRLPVGASLDADRRVQIDGDAAGRGGVVPDHRLGWTDETVDAVYRDRRDVALDAAVRWLQTSR